MLLLCNSYYLYRLLCQKFAHQKTRLLYHLNLSLRSLPIPIHRVGVVGRLRRKSKEKRRKRKIVNGLIWEFENKIPRQARPDNPDSYRDRETKVGVFFVSY